MTTQCFLKFQSFNIERLSSKLKDESFIDGLKNLILLHLMNPGYHERQIYTLMGITAIIRLELKLKKHIDIQVGSLF